MLSPYRPNVVVIDGRFAASHLGLIKACIPMGGNLYIVQAEVYSRIEKSPLVSIINAIGCCVMALNCLARICVTDIWEATILAVRETMIPTKSTEGVQVRSG